MMESTKQLYTIRETAAMLSLNYRTVLRLIGYGYINSIRIGRKHLVSRAEIDRFTNSANKQSIIYYMK